jgi:hypothetical protein
MNYFCTIEGQSANLRVHPLLLSLTKTFNASESTRSTPNICTISETDKRVLNHERYTSPDKLPPLDIHFSGGMGVSPFSNADCFILTLAAGCQECINKMQEERDWEDVQCMFTFVCI